MGKRKRSGSFSKGEDPSVKRSDAEDSQEELDPAEGLAGTKGGAVGLSASAASSAGTRCSARVQEKQEKLRRESSPSKQTGVGSCQDTGVAASSAATQIQKHDPQHRESVGNTGHSHGAHGGHCVLLPKGAKFPSPGSCESGGGAGHGLTAPPLSGSATSKEERKEKGGGEEEGRKKRNWELWSVEDKQMFFDALNESGKDFDAIQTYLANKGKGKKMGSFGVKNKDQVRHFYYRTWNKISKYLRFPEGMKKVNQELYGLINYGELRKKQRKLNSKTASKLCELVENGMTSIKIKGKTCRIKTPVCRALKRLNGLDDIDHSRVPVKVALEFTPKDGKSWRSVQNVAHNPRVKLVTSLQRTFASVIAYLEHKWKRNDDRLKEQFSSVFGKPRTRLRVVPADTHDFSIPLYRVAESANSATICLRAYKKNVLGRDDSANDCSTAKIKRKRKQSGGLGGSVNGHCDLSLRDEAGLPEQKKAGSFDYPMDAETSDAESQSALFPSEDCGKMQELPLLVLADQDQGNEAENEQLSKDEIFLRHLKNLEEYGAGQQELSSVEEQNGEFNNFPTETDYEHEEAEDEVSEKLEVGANKPVDEKFVSHIWDEEQVKKGWNAEEAGAMTVGEMYFMLGQTDKISFEYFWDGPESTEELHTHNLLETLISTAMLLRKKKNSRSKATPLLPTKPLKCSSCGSCTEVHPVCCSKNCSSSAMMNALMNLQKESVPLTPVSSSGSSPPGDATGEVKESEGQDNQIKFDESDLNLNVGSVSWNEAAGSAACNATANVSANSPRPQEGLIELCSIATSASSENYNIKATLLPPNSCMIRNPSGTISVVSSGERSNPNEQLTFHRPTQLRTLEPAQPAADVEFPPPKPFLDLPKGNRRLGRRPNFKRVVIPRVLPLLPKTPVISVTGDQLSSFIKVTATATSTQPSEEPGASSSRVATVVTNITSVNTNAAATVSSFFPEHSTLGRKCSETLPYEIFPKTAQGVGGGCSNSTDFEDLLKLKRNENSSSSINMNAGDVDSLSLSSFMDISLPESAKMTASECMNMEDLDNSNISLNFIRFDKDLMTPDASPAKSSRPLESLNNDSEQHWPISAVNDSDDFSFIHFASKRNATENTETDVNFQSMLDEGSLDFNSKLMELTNPMSETRK